LSLNYVAGVLEASAHVPFVLPRRWNFFLLVGRYAFDVSDEHGEARTHRCRSIRFVGRLQPSVYFETRRLRYGSASRRARFHETSMFRLTLIGLNHRPCVWFLCRGPRPRWPDSGGLWRSKSSGCGTHSSAWAETIRGRPESRAADLLRAAPPADTHCGAFGADCLKRAVVAGQARA
jgi:hypothetical protein